MADEEKMSVEEVQRAARLLRSKQGWDPTKRASEAPQEALRRLDQEARNEDIYASQCEACTSTREDSGDPTALCPEHLADAMGF